MNYNLYQPGITAPYQAQAIPTPTTPYLPATLNPQPVLQAPTSNVIHVNGIEGAKAYQLPANSQVLMLDENEPILYLKQTDGAAYPTISRYSLTAIEDSNPTNAATKSLEARVERLEEILNGKSNTTETGNGRSNAKGQQYSKHATN